MSSRSVPMTAVTSIRTEFRTRLAELRGRCTRVIGAFLRPRPMLPASCPTSPGISAILHEYGALAVWDYTAAAPSVRIAMADGMDAIVFSPHKFVGGPQTPGVLVVRRDLIGSDIPRYPAAARSRSWTRPAPCTPMTPSPARRAAHRPSSSPSAPVPSSR